MNGRRIWLAIPIALPLVLAACGEADRDYGPLAIYRGAWNGDDAHYGGILEIVGDCAYVNPGPSPGTRYLIGFSEQGTSWNDDSRVIRVPSGDLRAGDRIEMDGSETAPNSVLDWLKAPNATCDIANIWLAGEEIRSIR